ncbi:MAG: hypothetical protein AABX11_06560 [Nanoarchaeota archaeon]
MENTLTTIQVNGQVLSLLKKLKQEYGVNSYGEAIVIAVNKNKKKKSMAGVFGKLLSKKEKEEILRDDRREWERF